MIFSGACAKVPKEVQITVKLEYPTENWRPTTISVAKGGTVIWTNQGSVAHSVVSGEGLWPAKNLSVGESFKFTFPDAGTYTFDDDPGQAAGAGVIYVIGK